MAIKLYTKQLISVMPDIFAKKSAFLRSFGGALQITDGVKNTDTFFELKASDTDVVIQPYDLGADVAFGKGTGNSSRFGERKEVKSIDVQVPYEAPLATNEGVDNMTVNDDIDAVVAERLALNTVAWAQYVDGLLSQAISKAASKTLTGDFTSDSIAKVFAEAHKEFVNNNVSETIGHVAYVTADVYDAIINSPLTTTGKASTANIDNQTIVKFKGFEVVELPDTKFQKDEQIYFVADGVGVAGVGVQISRAMDSEDFAGIAIQSAGKYGKYIPEANQKAVVKAKLTASAPEAKADTAKADASKAK